MPDTTLAVVCWSGNELKVKKDRIVTERENAERLQLASRMARLLRAFPSSTIVTTPTSVAWRTSSTATSRTSAWHSTRRHRHH